MNTLAVLCSEYEVVGDSRLDPSLGDWILTGTDVARGVSVVVRSVSVTLADGWAECCSSSFVFLAGLMDFSLAILSWKCDRSIKNKRWHGAIRFSHCRQSVGQSDVEKIPSFLSTIKVNIEIHLDGHLHAKRKK